MTKTELDLYWQKLMSKGYTEYDVQTKREIYGFFIKFVLTTQFRRVNEKQLKYLLKNDTMSEDEWSIFVEQKWHLPGIALSDDIN